MTGYFAAINSRDYREAWRLDFYEHALESYARFRQGFSQTRHDTATITRVSQNVVTVSLAAGQTDGSVKYFTGTYTVKDGKIVYASVRASG